MGTRLSKAYMMTKVMTASNNEVIVYLYEGAIGYLHRARLALREERRADASTAIGRALGILIELSGGLNYTTGGHLAVQLEGLYNYLIKTLTLVNSHADLDALESCESLLTILYDAWRQAAASAEAQTAVKPESQLRISA